MTLQIYEGGGKSAKLNKKPQTDRGQETKWEIPIKGLPC
jgi:hypothetical protein